MKILKGCSCAILLLLAITGACQNSEKENMETTDQFKWQGSVSASPGYPVEVYRGGLESSDGSIGLDIGVRSGKKGWGYAGQGMGSSVRTVPNHLNVIWLSFAENTLYRINCALDYEKMVALFKAGYKVKGINDSIKHETYDNITTGFAPGGVVLLWISGAGKQVEIGRYQGEKTEISKETIAGLDGDVRVLFDPQYRKSVLEDTTAIPRAVQEEYRRKPIPYGLWDTYREKYLWKPTFIIPNGGGVEDVRFNYYNGEYDNIFEEDFPIKEFIKKPLLRRMSFGFHDKNKQRYGAEIIFNEKEVIDAFKEIYKKAPSAEIEIEIKVNVPYSYATIKLKTNGKQISLIKNKIEMFKSSRK